MKQYQVIVTKESALKAWLKQIDGYLKEQNLPVDSMLFRIYSDSIRKDPIRRVISEITNTFPGAVYVGATTKGNIIYGGLTDPHIAVICTIFQNPDTKVRVLQLPMDDSSQADSIALLKETLRQCSWVKAIEIMTTLNRLNTVSFCQSLSDLDPSIAIYGGGTNAIDIEEGHTEQTFVFSCKGDLQSHHAVFLLQGGDSLNISTRFMTGWRTLGKPFLVTACKGNVLLELNHKPALEVYQHYLGIAADEHFFRMANVFPFTLKSDSIEYLRVVTGYTENGGLRLAGHVTGGLQCTFNYGNAANILKSMNTSLQAVNDFQPETIQLFSCAARRYFWGVNAVSQETLPFESIAPTHGFYTSGEFLRSDGEVFLHNCTIVIVAMREGNAPAVKKEFIPGNIEISHQMRVSNSLVSFINAQSGTNGGERPEEAYVS